MSKKKRESNSKAIATFILGLLVGSLIEWMYWMRKQAAHQNGSGLAKHKLAFTEATGSDLDHQPAALAETHAPAHSGTIFPALVQFEAVSQPIQIPDDLKVIKGIGPVISKKLNQAGIYTFRELGNLSADRLREIVGDVIQRLANEDSLIEQAKILADKKDQGA